MKNSTTPPAESAIFVQIPAYRDRELAATLTDLYGQASSPERLRVSVLWQRATRDKLPSSIWGLPNLEIIEVPYEKSKGCNWARSVIQKRWRGEPYTLMIDSHHRFIADWDKILIHTHSRLKHCGSTRPVVTAYMPRYDPDTEPRGRQRRPYRIYPKRYEQGLLIHLTSYPISDADTLTGPVAAQFVSGHFIFAEGLFNQIVPMDPKLYFTGDEVAISLRALRTASTSSIQTESLDGTFMTDQVAFHTGTTTKRGISSTARRCNGCVDSFAGTYPADSALAHIAVSLTSSSHS